MSDSRQTLQLGPVVAATIVIAGLGIVLPLYLAYVDDRDGPAEVEISVDQEDAHGDAPDAAPPAMASIAAMSEAAPSDPFNDPAPGAEANSGVPENPPIRQLKSEPHEDDAESSPEFDSNRTSWEAPFNPAYWKATGWKFDSHGMLSNGEVSAATFRRAYNRFMVECLIEPYDDSAGPLLVHLKGAQANTLMTLEIDGNRLVVTDHSRDPAVVIKEEVVAPAAMNGEPARLKLAATGHRLIVSWNGAVALTCNQVADKSGSVIRFEFASTRAPWRIRDLRIEGE